MYLKTSAFTDVDKVRASSYNSLQALSTATVEWTQ